MNEIRDYIREEIEKIKTGKEKPEKYYISKETLNKTVNMIDEVTSEKDNIIFDVDGNIIEVDTKSLYAKIFGAVYTECYDFCKNITEEAVNKFNERV